jgi:hypothetical protein
VGLVLHTVTATAGDVAVVVEDGHAGVALLARLGRHFQVALLGELGAFLAIAFVVRIKAVLSHDLEAPVAAAWALRDDVEEDAVGVGEHFRRFLDLGAEVVDVRGVEADLVEAGLERADDPAGIFSFRRDLAPFGMGFYFLVVETGGEIDRDLYVDLLAGVHLGAQQIEIEVGVHRADLGGVIGHPVMALREAGDGIDVGVLERLLPVLFVEGGADALDVGRGVKIEVDLAEAEFLVGHGRRGEGSFSLVCTRISMTK